MEVTPADVAKWVGLPREQRPRLIDCREAEELAICQIEGNDWVPLVFFPLAGEKLTSNSERGVVVYCHHGMRSLRAASFLRSQGIENAFSMRGGIEEWADVVDSGMARY